MESRRFYSVERKDEICPEPAKIICVWGVDGDTARIQANEHFCFSPEFVCRRRSIRWIKENRHFTVCTIAIKDYSL